MGFSHLNAFTPRRIAVDYVSPAICQAMFSGSGEVFISLQPITLGQVEGVLWSWDGAFGTLNWTAYPGALCYSVYKAVDDDDPFGEYVIIAECVTDNFISNLVPGTYKIEAITPDGPTQFSTPIEGEGDPVPTPCPQVGPVPPANFLTPDEVTVETLNVDGALGFNSVTNIPTAGRYELIYQSGVIDEDCGLFLSEFVTSCYFRDNADVLIPFWDPTALMVQTVTVNYGCQWLFFQPQPCDAAVDIAAARPDGVLAQLDYLPLGFANPVIKLFGEPAGGCGAGTGMCVHVFKRTHKFLVQPAAVTVAGHPNGNVVLTISDYSVQSIQYLNGANQIVCNLPGVWQLNYGAGLWTGTKSYGSDPTGNYAKTSGTGPSCLVVA